MKKIGLMVCLSLAAFFLCVPRATAQATWGAINGYVTDPSGAAVPGANIKAKEVTTGIETTATSDSQGFFNLTHLTPGEYTVTAASHDPDGLWHDWMEEAVGFSVADSRYTAGVANLKAKVEAEIADYGQSAST